jgi:hypothetical protein
MHLSSAAFWAIQIDLLDFITQTLLLFDLQQAEAGSSNIRAHSDGFPSFVPMIIIFIFVRAVMLRKFVVHIEADSQRSISGGRGFRWL